MSTEPGVEYIVELIEHSEGWAVFEGSEGEDPRLSAWFNNLETAQKWVNDHNKPGTDPEVFDPEIARAHIRLAAWNDYRQPPEMENLLSTLLETGEAAGVTNNQDRVISVHKEPETP